MCDPLVDPRGQQTPPLFPCPTPARVPPPPTSQGRGTLFLEPWVSWCVPPFVLIPCPCPPPTPGRTGPWWGLDWREGGRIGIGLSSGDAFPPWPRVCTIPAPGVSLPPPAVPPPPPSDPFGFAFGPEGDAPGFGSLALPRPPRSQGVPGEKLAVVVVVVAGVRSLPDPPPHPRRGPV